MFRWYQNAAVCYVYLSGFSPSCEASWDNVLAHRWFTRGWTLQELIASKYVLFFSDPGKFLGSKEEMTPSLSKETGVPEAVLLGTSPLSTYSIEEKFSWAKRRKTTREEDKAYCMMGIFDVCMPPMYGEGEKKAMKRLRREIKEAALNPETESDTTEYLSASHSPAVTQLNTDAARSQVVSDHDQSSERLEQQRELSVSTDATGMVKNYFQLRLLC